jgi:hypothetical protein
MHLATWLIAGAVAALCIVAWVSKSLVWLAAALLVAALLLVPRIT